MADYDIIKMQRKLASALDEDRYWHTIGVMDTAACLAMKYGSNVNQARTAGLLHDCAKCIPNKKKIRLCQDHRIELTEFELAHPFLIHAKLGAFLAKRYYKVADPEILSAIRYHTTGRPGMTLLEEIVFTADYIEPLRAKAPHLDHLRKLAFEDLDACVYEILRDSVEYLEGKDSYDQTTLDAYRYYREHHILKMNQL